MHSFSFRLEAFQLAKFWDEKYRRPDLIEFTEAHPLVWPRLGA